MKTQTFHQEQKSTVCCGVLLAERVLELHENHAALFQKKECYHFFEFVKVERSSEL
jgi:hypothetical protein